MGKKEKQEKYNVGLYYRTPSGRVGAKNYTITAKDEGHAMKIAEKQFLKGKKGKGYKIQGGDAQKVKR